MRHAFFCETRIILGSLVFFILLLPISVLPLYAQTSYFYSSPLWNSSEPYLRITSTAVGDIDRDGDLDFICGTGLGTEPIVLYENRDGRLTAEPVWRQGYYQTYSVALGDIDNDGDLDLVCGNIGQPNVLYRNNGRRLEATPAWSSVESHSTFCIALGDMDNDGDLDLVCGNYSQANVLYENIGGTFSREATTIAYTYEQTQSLELGDINNDGFLDIVCGNNSEPNTLYTNTGIPFFFVQEWSSEESNLTWDVALGDVNGDGLLDLVCANYTQANTLYLNNQNGFEVTPAWTSSESRTTSSLALGDIDKDGDLDLACGNFSDTYISDVTYHSIYENTGGSFSAVPATELEHSNTTRSIELCDIDGDDYLDFLCGNSTNQNTLYENTGFGFGRAPIWVSNEELPTYKLALGDVDGDGDLDLVSGLYGRSGHQLMQLYENTGRALSAGPAWQEVENAGRAYQVMLNDIDGDRKLDLLIAVNTVTARPVQIHKNITGTSGLWFTDFPVWKCDSVGFDFRAGAVGDITSDGRPDLVCGNTIGPAMRMHVYANNDEWLSPQPIIWGQPTNIGELILGDINNDRAVDVVIATNAQTYLYLNTGSGFAKQPAWVDAPPYVNTGCVALGDLDGDDDLDLVCGNDPQSTGTGYNTIYENIGSTFTDTPQIKTFAETNDYTNGVALGDIDGDGDLDVVFGNNPSPSFCYENRNATFNDEPSWSIYQSETIETNDVALGDIDDDGDLDLVCANYGYLDFAYPGLSNPVYKHDLLQPSHQLANNPAFLRDVVVSQIDVNRYSVSFTAFDVEADRIFLACDYRLAQQSTWHPMQLIGGNTQGNRFGPFSSGPSGISGTFEWDVSQVPFSHQKMVIRMRLVEIPARISKIQYASSFFETIENVSPVRPELTPTDTLDYATTAVTVGDTLSREIVLLNSGTLDLTINNIELPSDEMHGSYTVPMVIAPYSSETIEILLCPEKQTAITGTITIESNDLVAPAQSVAIKTDIRELAVSSKLLNTEPKLPLGEAVTVVITPQPQVHVERGWVYHRSVGAPAFTDSVPISKLEDQFIATIHGAFVREAGLEYYIKVENSGIYATDPPEAPESGVYQRVVESPEGITVIVPDQFFLSENRRVDIGIELPQGADFVDGSIFFRRGGERSYISNTVRLVESGYEASIPDSMVSNRGVEFWVEVNTVTRTLTYPANNPPVNPEMFVVTVSNLEEPLIHAGGTEQSAYRMITIPLYLINEFTGTIEALLSDQPEFGSYDPMQWRVWRYLSATSTYQELGGATAGNFRPELGKVFWLICKDDHRISTAPIPGYSNSALTRTGGFSMTLQPQEWHAVGSPYTFPVLWDSVVVDTVPYARAVGTLIDGPVAHRGGYQYDVPALEPFEGYWVYNLSDNPLTLWIPPVEATNGSTRLAERTPAEQDGWTLTLSATAPPARDAVNVIGTAPGSERMLDKNDRLEPPPLPAGGLSLYFLTHDSQDRLVRLRTDMRPDPAETPDRGEVWTFDIAKLSSEEGGGDEVTVAIDEIERLPANVQASLVDLALGRSVPLAESAEYSFYLGERNYVTSEENARFRLIIGTEAFVQEETERLIDMPSRAALYQNYPNPFNPSTIIRYDVAEAGRVNLRIYDVHGALVRTLEERHREPGRYEAGWNGENEYGNRVGSGIYFYRVEMPGFTESRKMVLLK